MGTTVTFTSNLGKFQDALPPQIGAALEEIGLVAEGYAKRLCAVNTGNLRNSIAHTYDISERSAYIGTNVEYAPYVELGTGRYAEGGGGRSTPWSYKDSEGNWHTTYGNRPQPFLRPAVQDHRDEYRNIAEKHLKD